MATLIDNPIKIKPIAYNELHEPCPKIISFENFSYNNKFLILSSHAIPSSGNWYMELTITSKSSNYDFRYIPLMLGIHREPFKGILRADYILGSIYYQRGQKLYYKEYVADKYLTVDNYRGITHIPEKLYTSLPIKSIPPNENSPIWKGVIGLGVNLRDKILSIYKDGILLYTMTDITEFNTLTGYWYFAIYGAEQALVSGKINYGRYKFLYKDIIKDKYEITYKSLYDYHYPPEEITYHPPIIYEPPYPDLHRADFNCSINVENEISPIDYITKNRYIYLEHKVQEMTNLDDVLQFKMYANRGNTAPDMTTINVPCPCEQFPVYFEMSVQEAQIVRDKYAVDKYIGIPVEVGLTIKKNDYKQKSFRVSLYREKGQDYKAYAVYNELVEDKDHVLVETMQEILIDFPQAQNPATPVQPDIMGFLFDRRNNKITLYTAGTIFCEIPIQVVDFSDPKDIAYIFIKSADHVYSGYLKGIVNVGEETIQLSLPEGAVTLYDYYIESIRWFLTEPFPEFSCQLRVKNRKNDYSSDILGHVYLPPNKDEHWNGFDRGLNLLHKDFSIVEDVEEKRNTPYLSFIMFQNILKDYWN